MAKAVAQVPALVPADPRQERGWQLCLCAAQASPVVRGEAGTLLYALAEG